MAQEGITQSFDCFQIYRTWLLANMAQTETKPAI